MGWSVAASQSWMAVAEDGVPAIGGARQHRLAIGCQRDRFHRPLGIVDDLRFRSVGVDDANGVVLPGQHHLAQVVTEELGHGALRAEAGIPAAAIVAGVYLQFALVLPGLQVVKDQRAVVARHGGQRVAMSRDGLGMTDADDDFRGVAA